MEMLLEVGMYIRTKWGYICELININDFREPSFKYGVEANYLRDVMFIGDEDIEKASHNIIDLIEVGDFVNGYKISAIYDDDSVVNEYNLKHKKCLGKNIYDEDYQEYLIYEEDIETIVTKEQIEAVNELKKGK